MKQFTWACHRVLVGTAAMAPATVWSRDKADDYSSLGYGSDLYVHNPNVNDLRRLVNAWEHGHDVWPWVWTWRNPHGPHHVFIGLNERVDRAIEALAVDEQNNMIVVASPSEFARRGMAYYMKHRCAIVHSHVALMDVEAKLLMLQDERIICFDECTIVDSRKGDDDVLPGDALAWNYNSAASPRRQSE